MVKRIGKSQPDPFGTQLPKEVLETPEFDKVVDQLAAESGKSKKQIRAEAKSCLGEMAAGQDRVVNEAWNRAARWAARAYKFDIDDAAIDQIKALSAQHSLIFLPNHRSYLDPMVLRSALSRHGFPPNYVLGGANLSFWPMSSIGHRNGMVFIRRSMKGADVYKAVLRAYLGYLMSSGENLEWYIEGGRTRTGKLRKPRLGILNYVVNGFENGDADDVLLVPVSVMYDQQHEVDAISAEEVGGSKSPEDIRWMLKFFASQSRRLGRAHLRFGEPLSLSAALADARQHSPDDRHVIPKVAFEVCHRINQATPIMPSALLTFALLDNDDRALTIEQGREILIPLLEYINKRNLPITSDFDLNEAGNMTKPLKMLMREGVVEEFTDGLEPTYAIADGRAHEAGFYRNSVSHLFITRAIVETAIVRMAEDQPEDLAVACFAEARRLRDLLKFEFFFPSTMEFSRDVIAETDIMRPGWQDEDLDSSQLLSLMEQGNLQLAHRVLGPFVEAYGVAADRLAMRTPGEPIDEKDFLQECIKSAQQRWRQRDLHSPESISKDLFSGCLQLAANRGLLEPDVTQEQRSAFAAEIADVVRRVGLVRAIANRP